MALLSSNSPITNLLLFKKFLYVFDDVKIPSLSPEHINDLIFTFKKFGKKNSNHFICEMFPLPKQKKDSIGEYKSIWNTLDDYYTEVKAKRFDLINNTVIDSEVE
jgi:hypothetical protein